MAPDFMMYTTLHIVVATSRVVCGSESCEVMSLAVRVVPALNVPDVCVSCRGDVSKAGPSPSKG